MIENDYYDEVIDSPIVENFISDNYPNADNYQIASFKNSVAYGVTKASGGYGGPSMREHLACSKLIGKVLPLDEIMELIAPICFGEITKEHAYYLKNNYCFDDNPSDIEKAQEILQHD